MGLGGNVEDWDLVGGGVVEFVGYEGCGGMGGRLDSGWDGFGVVFVDFVGEVFGGRGGI